MQVFLHDSAWIGTAFGLVLGLWPWWGEARGDGTRWLWRGIALLALWLLSSLPLPALIAIHGHLWWPALVVGYGGVWGVSAVGMAIGYGSRSLFARPLGAWLLGASLWWLLAQAWSWSAELTPDLAAGVRYLSLYEKHFYPAMRGVWRFSDLVYAGSFVYAAWLIGTLIPRVREQKAKTRWLVGYGASALLCLLAANVLAERHDLRRDASAPNRIGPSATTVALARALPVPPKVYVFMRDGRLAAAAAGPYVKALASRVGALELQVRDADLSPGLTRAYGVPGNGHLVLVYGPPDAGPAAADVVPLGRGEVDARRRLAQLDTMLVRALSARTGRSQPAPATVRPAVVHVPGDERTLLLGLSALPAALVGAWVVRAALKARRP